MFLWGRVKFFVAVLLILNIIYEHGHADDAALLQERDIENDIQFMDYGSTTTWKPWLRTSRLTEKTHTAATITSEDFFIFRPYPEFVGLDSNTHSPGSTELKGSSSRLSPEQALEYAKLLVLPINDTSRQRGLRSYGTNRQGMERMMEEWMNEHVNGTFLHPLNVGLRFQSDPYDFDKLLTTPDSWNYFSSQGDPAGKAKLNLPGASFWEEGSPLHQFAATTSHYNIDGKQRLDLPGASFWEEGNPKAQPHQPIFVTTIRYNIDSNIREKDKIPEDPSDHLDTATKTQTNLKPLHITLTMPSAVKPNVGRIHDKINKVIDHEDTDNVMYDYKLPPWDEMPTIGLLTVPSTTPTEPDPSPPEYLSPGYPIVAPTTVNTNHRAVVRAKEFMRNHHLKYLSAFICGFCEILSIHKEGALTRQLTMGAVAAVNDVIQENKLAHLGTTTRDKLTKIVNFLVLDRPDEIKSVADYMHQLYENHSYFANDTREVVEAIENWFIVSEGEALLQTLISVEEFPKQGKSYRVVMREVVDALLKPYVRLGPSARRAKTLNKLEILMERVHRRRFSSYDDNKRVERTDLSTFTKGGRRDFLRKHLHEIRKGGNENKGSNGSHFKTDEKIGHKKEQRVPETRHESRGRIRKKHKSNIEQHEIAMKQKEGSSKSHQLQNDKITAVRRIDMNDFNKIKVKEFSTMNRVIKQKLHSGNSQN